jgi:cytohesin
MASENVCRAYLRDIIERRDRSGKTPLHHAVGNNEINFIKFLIEAGADINAKDNQGNTPLNNFPLYHDEDSYEARIDTLSFLIANGAEINNKNNKGYTILHSAVLKGNIDFVRFLLQQGANINTVDNYGNTPLHTALEDAEMVELLLKYHPDIIKNSRGQTPLDVAEENHLEDLYEMIGEYIENLPEIKEPDIY